ncbi:MAG TPA: hypothetical protein VJ044_05605, partial [Candidatus Hodarchaeales archaeon]|nr:hypothetical protein [Candidatus Hodarchaeales archaeon]
ANMIILQATAQVAALTEEGNQAPTSTETAIITETEIPTEESTSTATPQPTATSVPPTATVYVAPPPTATLFVLIQATTTSAPKGNCHPSYEGACLLQGIGDYDCEGGGGNGPNYIKGPIRVVGYDEFQLDREGDGIACE